MELYQLQTYDFRLPFGNRCTYAIFRSYSPCWLAFHIVLDLLARGLGIENEDCKLIAISSAPLKSMDYLSWHMSVEDLALMHFLTCCHWTNFPSNYISALYCAIKVPMILQNSFWSSDMIKATLEGLWQIDGALWRSQPFLFSQSLWDLILCTTESLLLNLLPTRAEYSSLWMGM